MGFLLGFEVGSLNRTVPGLFALALVELAHSVDLPHHLSVNGDAFFRIELFLLQHRQVEHLVLHF